MQRKAHKEDMGGGGGRDGGGGGGRDIDGSPGTEFKGFNLGFCQCTFLYTTLKCITIFVDTGIILNSSLCGRIPAVADPPAP